MATVSIPTFLMTSRRIVAMLEAIVAQGAVQGDKQMAVIVALKFAVPRHLRVPTQALITELASMQRADLVELARLIHPQLCALQLEKWTDEGGAYGYVAEQAHGRGKEGLRLQLNGAGADMPDMFFKRASAA